MLVTYTSTIHDGSMKILHDTEAHEIDEHRVQFLSKHQIEPNDTTLLRLVYEGNDYCRYQSLSNIDRGNGITRKSTIIADALVATEPHHAIFLPLADCIGAVIHDPTKGVLMVSHLGRHNLEQNGGKHCIEYLINNHNVDPKDVVVWLSPAASQESYPLHSFDHRGLHDVAAEQLKGAGIIEEQLTISPINSATDPDYYSHSQFLKGNQTNDGRFAVVAMMS